MLLSVNGSPYEIDKDDRRLGRVFADRVAETRLPLVYLNRVGGQDELVFDGCSFILDGDGRTLHRLVRSEEHTSELQSLMRISYAVFCLKKKTTIHMNKNQNHRELHKHTK